MWLAYLSYRTKLLSQQHTPSFTFITLVLHFGRHHVAAIHTDGFRARTRLNNLRPWRVSDGNGSGKPHGSQTEKRNNGLDDWKNSMTQQNAKFIVPADDSKTYSGQVKWKGGSKIRW